MSHYLAIGCGGTIGAAWTIAALAELEKQSGVATSEYSVLQGTSAGAEIVTMLGGGATTAELTAMQSGTSVNAVLQAHIAATAPSFPPVLRSLPMRPRGLADRRGGHRALAGLAPRGRADSSWLQRLADAYEPTTGSRDVRRVAYDMWADERVAFGAPGAPPASAEAALRASWAVPGWLPPVTIDGRIYIDGGAASTASVDLLEASRGDTVHVIAPMASASGVRKPGPGGFAEYVALRRTMSTVLDAEIALLRARGATVIDIRPNERSLTVLPANFMARRARAAAFDAARRLMPELITAALQDAS